MNTTLYDQLRSYQKEAVEFMRPRRRILLFDDMGLGKTLTTLYKEEETHPDDIPYNHLIVCGKKSLYVWQRQIAKWLNKPAFIYHHNSKAKRLKLWQQFLKKPRTSYFITTYGLLQEVIDLAAKDKGSARFEASFAIYGTVWDSFVADEIHENGLLNHKTQTFGRIEKYARNIPLVVLITGTPIRRGVIDLYAPLHIMNKKEFPSYWQFVGKHCITLQGPYGKEIERLPRDVTEFRQILGNYMIRRTKAELRNRPDLGDLPDKERQIIEVEMNTEQQRIYDTLVNQMFSIEGDNVIIAPNQMTLLIRLKQLLVCPRILGIDNDGAALETIVEMGKSLIDNYQPFVIFTPFSQALPYIKAAVTKAMPKTHIYTIQGGLTAKEFAAQWMGFQDNPSKNKVLLCVIKSSSSFDAYEASYGFFLGYEEDFNFNEQSEDRLCRQGQKSFVNIYYMLHRGTVDEAVKARLNAKKEASNWIIGSEDTYKTLLQKYKVQRLLVNRK